MKIQLRFNLGATPDGVQDKFLALCPGITFKGFIQWSYEVIEIELWSTGWKASMLPTEYVEGIIWVLSLQRKGTVRVLIYPTVDFRIDPI